MHMKKTNALLAGSALALSLALTGCGNGDDDKAAKAIAASMMESNDETFKVEQKDADCVGEGFVDKIGVDKLKKYGVLTDDLKAKDAGLDGSVTMEAGDADKAADVVVGCVDTKKMFTDSMAKDSGVTEDQKKCMTDALDDDAMKKMFSLIFQGKDEEAGKDLVGPMMACMG